MKGTSTALTVLTLLLPPVHLQAKGDTIRITVKGGKLAAPIEITDPAIIRRFNFWTGPGTGRVSSDGTPLPGFGQGFIVDWSRGIVEPPKGLQLFDVSFVTTRRDPSTYVVRYGIDPATNEGYVYIPGKADAEYRDNTWLIYRGIEGNWFHAWSAWEKIANPLIANSPHKSE